MQETVQVMEIKSGDIAIREVRLPDRLDALAGQSGGQFLRIGGKTGRDPDKSSASQTRNQHQYQEAKKSQR
jgi:hypothetical protein